MDFIPVSYRGSLAEYEAQASLLLKGWRAGDSDTIQLFRTRHPRFLDEKTPWLPKNFSDEEIRTVQLDLADAQLALARRYDFRDWAALEEYVASVRAENSAAFRFESAVEAVLNGDIETLAGLLRADHGLVRARSTRVTHFDPPKHRATLLHYVAANGVEGYRQTSTPNAVAIARTLLEAGAEVDALADMYGGKCTTMSMLVSSEPPAKAGVQIPLVVTLLDFGADIEGRGTGQWVSPLKTALAFGFLSAAEVLVKHGAQIADLAVAAGLGRISLVREMLATAGGEDRHRALALAAQHGHLDVVRLLLDAGEDPNRYNPQGNHSHSTPLHQAALAGHGGVVHLLVERGANLEIKDRIYQGTPRGWAAYAGQHEIEEYLRAQVERKDYRH